MRLTVKADASLVVSVPWRLREEIAMRFVREKTDWILSKIAYLKNKKSSLPEASREDYLRCKKLAKEIIEKKLKYYNQFYNFTWGTVSIRNQKTRWGSCSRDGNLSFSYRIIYLPEKACDYIVVHELCHRGEFNHSQKFWNLVAKNIPEYRKIRKEIRNL